MSKVALNVAIQTKPGASDRVLAALLAHQKRCLATEPGTLQFEVMVCLEDPSQLFLFELYADENAFQAHGAGDSIAQYRLDVADDIESVKGTRCSLGQ